MTHKNMLRLSDSALPRTSCEVNMLELTRKVQELRKRVEALEEGKVGWDTVLTPKDQ